MNPRSSPRVPPRSETFAYRGSEWHRKSLGTTGLLYDSDNVIADLDGSTVSRFYVTPMLDQNVSMTVTSGDQVGTYFHSQDERQSVRTLTDSAGTVVARYDYTPFGEPIPTAATGATSPTIATLNRYTYTGRELNPYSGNFVFRYRTYGPGAGIFAARDPLGYVDGESGYAGYFATRATADSFGLALIPYNGDYRKARWSPEANVKYGAQTDLTTIKDVDVTLRKEKEQGSETGKDRCYVQLLGEMGIGFKYNDKDYRSAKAAQDDIRERKDGTKITVSEHEYEHAERWVQFWNNSFLPAVNKYEGKETCCECEKEWKSYVKAEYNNLLVAPQEGDIRQDLRDYRNARWIRMRKMDLDLLTGGEKGEFKNPIKKQRQDARDATLKQLQSCCKKAEWAP